MFVLGVDQSLTMTGLAVSEFGVRTSRVKSEPADGTLAGDRKRIRYIVSQVLRFAPPVCLSVIEAPYVPQGGKAAGAVIERAWLFGLLVDQLMQRGPVVQVRTKTRAMYATGNGNAKKAEVLAAVRAAFPDLEVADDNVADALALLGMGARWMGEPIDGELSKKQLSAMDAVQWPDKKEMTK